MARIKRPASFRSGVFDWEVKYHSGPSDIHGDTHRDTRTINVFTGGFNEQIVKDTLLHECLHVVLEDIVDTTYKMEDKSENVEEQVVRLLTPRLHSLFTDNEDLREYIFSRASSS